MAADNRSWGQRRIQAELARLGFKVPARTVATYMQRPTHRRPSTGWRLFLKQHAATIWACDFFCVQTILFRTFYVFFVIHHASRQVLHVHVTFSLGQISRKGQNPEGRASAGEAITRRTPREQSQCDHPPDPKSVDPHRRSRCQYQKKFLISGPIRSRIIFVYSTMPDTPCHTATMQTRHTPLR
jgi:hypothetical protein